MNASKKAVAAMLDKARAAIDSAEMLVGTDNQAAARRLEEASSCMWDAQSLMRDEIIDAIDKAFS